MINENSLKNLEKGKEKRFKKGHIPWSKGKHLIYSNPTERGKKISKGLKKAYQEGRRKYNPNGINKILAEKLYLGNAFKNKKIKIKCQYCEKEFETFKRKRGMRFCSKECAYSFRKGKMPKKDIGSLMRGKSAWSKGKKFPERSGENHPNWIKDRSLIKVGDRSLNDPLQKQWSMGVKSRDNWKCKINNKDCNGKVVAHHILCWRDFPELRFNINNGITLCQAHHPIKRAEEKRLIPFFTGLMSVSNELKSL